MPNTQPLPSFDAALSDARTATRNAQALVDRLRGELGEAQARWEVLAEQYTQEVLRRSQAVQERDKLRAAADRAISNLGIIAVRSDDPHIEEICNVTADLLGAALTPGAAGEGA